MNQLRSRSKVTVAVVLALGLLGACGGAEKAPPPAPVTPSPTPVAIAPTPLPPTPVVVAPTPLPPTPTPVKTFAVGGYRHIRNAQPIDIAPRRGGIAKIGFSSPPANFDPISISFTTYQAIGSVYQQLVRPAYFTEMKNPNIFDVELVNELASRWSLSPDFKTLTIEVRDNVFFQNIDPVNGRKLDKEDVKFSLDLYRASPLFAAFYEDVDSITTEEPNKVVIRLKEPNATFGEATLTYFHTRILPKELNTAELRRAKAIGTGPFQHGPGFDPVTRHVFVKNPNYWRQGFPYLDRYEVTIISDSATAKAVVTTGQLDYADFANPGDTREIEALLRTNPNLVVAEVLPDRNIFNLAIRVTREPWKDIRVRRAFLKMLDYKNLIDVFTEGRGSILPPFTWFTIADTMPTLADWPADYQKRDPDGSRALLREAGITTPVKFDLEWAPYGGGNVLFAQAVKELVSPLFEANLVQKSVVEFTGRYAPLSYPDMALGPSRSGTSLDTATYRQFHSKFVRKGNLGGIEDPVLDDLTVKYRLTTDPNQRKAILKQIAERIQEQVYLLPMPEGVRYLVHSPKLFNVAWSWRLLWPHVGSAYWEIIWKQP